MFADCITALKQSKPVLKSIRFDQVKRSSNHWSLQDAPDEKTLFQYRSFC